MQQLPPEEERFAVNTSSMAEAIYDSVLQLNSMGYKTADPNLVKLVSLMISGFDKHYLIKGFIDNSHQVCWDAIKRREEEFFVKNSGDIFKYLPTDKVDLFRDLFTTKDHTGTCVIEQYVKDDIWALFDKMIKISIKYIHKNRKPVLIQTPNGPAKRYTESFYPEINLQQHASNWNVELEFNIDY